MKKIFTLLLAGATVFSVNAQTSKEEARRVILGQGGGSKTTTGNGGNTQNPRDIILGGGGNNGNTDYPNSYPSNGSREARIDAINREYNNKIYSIRNNSTLSSAEKERMIRQLENDRARRIRQINNEYNENNNSNGNTGNKKYKKNKSNNGKHKGWTKGKGNQKKQNRDYDGDDD